MRLVALIIATVSVLATTSIVRADTSGPEDPISVTKCNAYGDFSDTVVEFTNLASTDATAVEIDLVFLDAFGDVVQTRSMQHSGTFSTGVKIHAEYQILAPPAYTSYVCLPKRVLFEDGTLWKAP
jgi:hypothetical protein